jgi:hypothetical protein
MMIAVGCPASSYSSKDRPPMLKTKLIDNGEMRVYLAEDLQGPLIAKRCLQRYKDEEVGSGCILSIHTYINYYHRSFKRKCTNMK